MTYLESPGGAFTSYFTAADLMVQEFPEPKWAVDGLIPEGLTLLVGSPKLGKSWMCLGLGVAVATGGRALGKIKVDQGEVLYAALEDSPRRLQDRLSKVLAGASAPAALHMTTGLPKMPDAVDLLDEWASRHPGARLIVVDVLRKIRPATDARANMYEGDYDVAGQLKALADKHKIAVVAVHHTRKATDEGDVFNEASGSTGLTGAADAILIAKKARNTSEAVLHITGRDVREDSHALTWDGETCMWRLLDEPVFIVEQSATRRRITEHLATMQGDRPASIAKALGLTGANVRVMLRKMVADDQLDSDGDGNYFLRLQESLTPFTPLTPEAPAVTAVNGVNALPGDAA